MNDSKTKKAGVAVTVPHLAESLVSATVGKWLVAPGDYVKQYDVICELITDKVSTEMPSPVEGVVAELLVGEGVEAAVGETLCIIDSPEHAAGEPAAPEASAPAAAAPARQAAAGGGAMRRRYSPAVLALAAKHGIRLDEAPIVGTGLEGRITRKDVLAYVEADGPLRCGAA